MMVMIVNPRPASSDPLRASAVFAQLMQPWIEARRRKMELEAQWQAQANAQTSEAIGQGLSTLGGLAGQYFQARGERRKEGRENADLLGLLNAAYPAGGGYTPGSEVMPGTGPLRPEFLSGTGPGIGSLGVMRDPPEGADGQMIAAVRGMLGRGGRASPMAGRLAEGLIRRRLGSGRTPTMEDRLLGLIPESERTDAARARFGLIPKAKGKDPYTKTPWYMAEDVPADVRESYKAKATTPEQRDLTKARTALATRQAAAAPEDRTARDTSLLDKHYERKAKRLQAQIDEIEMDLADYGDKAAEDGWFYDTPETELYNGKPATTSQIENRKRLQNQKARLEGELAGINAEWDRLLKPVTRPATDPDGLTPDERAWVDSKPDKQRALEIIRRRKGR